MKQLLKVLPLMALCLYLQPAMAAPLIYEPFPTTYTVGSQLGSTTSATVWAFGNGTGTGSALIDTNAALSYSGLQESSGYGITSTTASSRNRGFDFGLQTFSATITNIYASFLLKPVANPSANKCLVYLRASTGSGTPHLGVFLNASGQLMVSKNSGTPAATNTAALTLGQTYLVVFRYKSVSGSANDEVALWVSPTSGQLGVDENSVPAPTISTIAGGSDQTALQGFFVAGLLADSSLQYMDEIRVGYTWADVTPAGGCNPATVTTNPVSTSATVGGTANFAISATGSSRTYQWQVSTDNGTSWNPVSTGTGGTSASYTTATLGAGDNGSQFRCVVSVACDGSTNASTAATLSVVDPTGKYFRSAASGNWNSAATWEMSNDGNTWGAANVSPSSLASNITVRAGHSVTVTANVTADDLTVESGATLSAGGGTLTLNDGGAAVDCNVLGILSVANAAGSGIANSGTAVLAFGNGGQFIWDLAAAPAIPTATWANGSTCTVTRGAAATQTPTGLSQDFYNFAWNWPSQANSATFGGGLTNVRGDFTVTAGSTVTIAGTAAATLNVRGNFTNNGTGKILWQAANSAGVTVNVNGNFVNTGTVDPNSNGTGPVINFTGTGTQVFTSGGRSGNAARHSYNVAAGATVVLGDNLGVYAAFGDSGTLNFGGFQMTGAGALTLNSGCTVVANAATPFSTGLTSIAFGGTLSWANVPTTLNNGDSVQVATATSYSGTFSSISPSVTPVTGLTWDQSQLASTGKLFAGGASPGVPSVTSTVNGSLQVLTIVNGPASTGFSVLTNGDLTTPKASWPVAGSGTFDGSGTATYTNPVGAGSGFQSIRVP